MANAPSQGGGFGQWRGRGYGGYSAGLDAEGGHGSGSSHSGGPGLAVLAELVARSSLDRVWFGIGEVIPSKADSGHLWNPSLPDTAKRLLDALPTRIPPRP